jgi:mannose-6-phosphate isomerase-like protein (cupin superfamily)
LAGRNADVQFSGMAQRPQAFASSKAINPLRESRSISAPYHNSRVAAANDHEIRMSVMTAGFEWHRHPRSDEVFLVIEGELMIELEDRQVVLGEGDLFTVPKGVVHRTRPVGARSVNLTFERGDAGTVYVCRGNGDQGTDCG